jgi:hypothetical protein
VSALWTVEYRHPRLGFRIPVPESWERIVDSQDVPLIVVEPESGPLLRTNLVVTVEEVDPELPAVDLQTRSIALLGEHLRGFWLIDREEGQVNCRPLYRTLGHHITDAGPVTAEQWLHFGSTHCYTVTVSVNTLKYPVYRESLAEMARELRLPEEPT